jgi:large subunit ribosomal protein L21
MFAIIATGGKQQSISLNQKLLVEKLEGNAGDKITLSDVLAYNDGTTTRVGAPTLKGVSVVAEIVEQTRGEKLIIFKKKRRQNYRRKNGHAQLLTQIKILEIKAA